MDSSTAETCVFLDENNEPLCKVIAWMDGKKRQNICQSISEKKEIIKVGFEYSRSIQSVKILAVKTNLGKFANTRMFAQI